MLLRTTLLVGIVLGVSPGGAAESLLPLHGWHSRSRSDHFATTHGGWHGSPGERRSPDYTHSRLHGHLLRDPLPGTVPLHNWFSPSRGDNFTTSHPDWLGAPGETRPPDYRFGGSQGHIYERALAGTVPLNAWFSSTLGDSAVTTDILWGGGIGRVRPVDYRLFDVAGHMLPADESTELVDPMVFGHGTAELSEALPLLVVMVEFSDFPLRGSTADMEREVFGPQEPNLVGLFRSLSAGRVTFTRAGVVRINVGPSSFALPSFDRFILGWTEDLGGVDFRRFDANRDGRVTNDELAILYVIADYGCCRGGGQTRGLPTSRVSGVVADLRVSFCDEYGDINLKAHELYHRIFLRGQHLYGPGASLNFRASFFAGSVVYNPASPTVRPVYLDPWHRMINGWLRPRVMQLGDAANSAAIGAKHQAGSLAPIILVDPARSFREFFMIEYRNPNASGVNYDSGAAGQGVAVWYVRRNDAGVLDDVEWPPPGYDGPEGHAYAHYLIGPNGAGRTPFWTEEHGIGLLRWGDGTDAAWIRVGSMARESQIVSFEWRRPGRPFLPRVDCVEPARTRAGGRVTVDGRFPVTRSDTRVRLSGPGGEFTLRTVSLALDRILFDVPPTVPAGSYRLSVASDSAGRTTGNWRELDVAGATLDSFRRGDATRDGVVDISDGRRVLDYLFLGGDLGCLDAADTDDNGLLELSDAVRIFNYLFLGGVVIRGVDGCFRDETRDSLGCEEYAACP